MVVKLAIKDLRQFLQTLEQEGQLKRINKEIHWKNELAAILRRGFDVYGDACPAFLFENITDYQGECTKILSGLFRSYLRIALALGMKGVKEPVEIVREWRKRTKKPVKVKWIESGPCKDNIDEGAEIDLLKFPVPFWHSRDGGRFIGTLASAITKDPDTGWLNVGNYRLQVLEKNVTGILIRPGWEHAGLHFSKYIEREEPMPISIVIGGPPLCTYVGTVPFPSEVFEYEMAGALMGESVEVVKSECSDIPVPASAEIIIEGIIDPKKRIMEGPFGEFTGYYGSIPTPKPVIEVKRVTYRNDPIFLGTLEGYVINEGGTMNSIGNSSIAWDILVDAGIPGIQNVACSRTSSGAGHAYVSVKPIVEGIAPIIASALWGNHASYDKFKMIVVVDEDIDPWNLEQVEWVVWSRTKADESIHVLKGTRGTSLDPRVPPAEKGYWERVLIDTTRPFHWEPQMVWATDGAYKGIPLKYPPISRPDPDTMALVNEKWEEYGIEPTKEYIGKNIGVFHNWWTKEFIDGLRKLKITR